MRSILITSILVACSISIGSSARAAWIEDGVPVCTASGIQNGNNIISDGAGGAIVVWEDSRHSGYGDIYAQRIDLFGNPLWGYDGVAICLANSYQDDPVVVPDGSGGAIFAWQDRRDSGNAIYAQRVDAQGITQWADHGVPVCTSSGSMQSLVITADGMGGAIMGWSDRRSGSDRIYAQRINSSGVTQWAASGVRVCTSEYMQTYSEVVADGPGEAIFIWRDVRDYEATWTDIYAQRINFFGSPSWPAIGVAVGTNDYQDSMFSMVSSSTGGAIVAWQYEDGENYGDIHAQHIDSAGSLQWEPGGVILCSEGSTQLKPSAISDGTGGAIVAWADGRGSDLDIYAQRVSSTGNPQWPADGVSIAGASGYQDNPIAVTDGMGGALIFWDDDLGGDSAHEIKACRINAAGSLMWPGGEMPVCTMPGDQWDISLASDGAGNVIAAWEDHRTGWDVYAQRIEGRHGYWGLPEPFITSVVDNPADQGGKVVLNWTASERDALNMQTITHYSIWRATDVLLAKPGILEEDGAGVSLAEIDMDFEGPALRMSQEQSKDYYWEWVGNQDALYAAGYSFLANTRQDSVEDETARHYFQVVAHTVNAYRFWPSPPDSGHSVDNLAPAVPAKLLGEVLYGPEGLQLTWKPNNEPDLGYYSVYRGLSEDFIPDEDSLFASQSDTTSFDGSWTLDGGYYYKVSAIDIHANESDYALLIPEEITGTETPVSPKRVYLKQNFPNPFNPSTTIEFGMDRPGNVSLNVYDTAGRLVRAVFSGERPAGRYSETWDGRDDIGREVSSGVYFYQLDTGSTVQTKRMTLLR